LLRCEILPGSRRLRSAARIAEIPPATSILRLRRSAVIRRRRLRLRTRILERRALAATEAVLIAAARSLILRALRTLCTLRAGRAEPSPAAAIAAAALGPARTDVDLALLAAEPVLSRARLVPTAGYPARFHTALLPALLLPKGRPLRRRRLLVLEEPYILIRPRYKRLPVAEPPVVVSRCDRHPAVEYTRLPHLVA
jgi:hypothetical protein